MIELSEQLQNKISPEPNSGCWLWTGALERCGYGQVHIKRKNKMAHRIIYEFYKGPIPEGYELDHLCRVRSCVNPDHLEIVRHITNVQRGNSGINHSSKTHCKHGHEFSEANIHYNFNRGTRERVCITCMKRRSRLNYEKRRLDT